jgi:hypothetical protein
MFEGEARARAKARMSRAKARMSRPKVSASALRGLVKGVRERVEWEGEARLERVVSEVL